MSTAYDPLPEQEPWRSAAIARRANDLVCAEAELREALEEYRRAAALASVLDPTDIVYRASSAGRDNIRYTVGGSSHSFRYDGPFQAAQGAGDTLFEALLLAASPHWQDRVRAEALLAAEHRPVTLPDGFPAIYEVEDSPNKARNKYRTRDPWVVSPDEAMLIELLPMYQELWDAYTAQWGPASRRVFAVGRLDGMSPRGVYRPGTTPEQVVGETMITHGDMYQRAPQHIKEMHPLHESWERSRRERLAAHAGRQENNEGSSR